MNPQSEEDLQYRLQQLEAEINSKSRVIPPSPSQKIIKPWLSAFPQLYSTTARLAIWFNKLSGMAKVVVLGVAVLFSFAILQFVFKLVTAVISLALLGILVYLGYKFLVSGSSQNKQ